MNKEQNLNNQQNQQLNIAGVSKRLLITQCSDSMMWYANKIGKEVEFIREESDCYLSREDAGFINIVKKCDAVILNVC